MLLSYKIEFFNENRIRVNVVNHNRPSLDTAKEFEEFYIHYKYFPENACFVQCDSTHGYAFYTNDKELLATLNREVNVFAQNNKFKKD